MAQHESWNTREFCLRAANDFDLYNEAQRILGARKAKGVNPYKATGVARWARDVADSCTPKIRVTKVAISAALEACDL
jgi:hypothetical protein